MPIWKWIPRMEPLPKVLNPVPFWVRLSVIMAIWFIPLLVTDFSGKYPNLEGLEFIPPVIWGYGWTMFLLPYIYTLAMLPALFITMGMTTFSLFIVFNPSKSMTFWCQVILLIVLVLLAESGLAFFNPSRIPAIY